MSTADPSCIFCRIIAGIIPSTQVFADDAVIAVRDVNPQAPVHVLVLPRRHIPSIAAIGPEDGQLLARMIGAANQVAREQQVAESGYRLVVNQGEDAGQTVAHLHLHVLGGRQLTWPPG